MQQKRKKILFLITKGSWGGAQQYVYDLATNIYNEEFEPVVALGGEGILRDSLGASGIRVLTIPHLQRNVSFVGDLLSSLAIAKIIYTERPDILHINSSKVGALGAVLGRLFFVRKIIFTALGWAFNEDRPQWQKTIIKSIQWLTVMLSHTTIVISHGTKKDMDWPLVQKKMRVIHLGRTVGIMEHREDARGILETKVIDNTANLSDYHDDFWIGTIAELHPIKRIDRAIDAVAALTKDFPDLRFVIIHDGELKAQLQQQVRDLKLEHHVFFTGIIKNAARLLPAFDLFVLPSRSEAFGYVLIEAGQAHVPVVATNVGGIPDIVTDNVSGLLVSPDDTFALASALRTLIENKELREKFAEAHYKKSQEFTLGKMLSETISVYKS